MATQPAGIDEGALAASWQSALTATPAPAPETVTPDPAPAEGSTPPVDAAPASAPEGTTPSQPSPASAVDDQDLAFALEKAGISKDDPQALSKLAKLYRETNNRAGEMGRELQALRKEPVVTPAVQPTAPPPVLAPTPQAPPAEPQQTLEQYVEALVQQDREYIALDQDFAALTEEQSQLAQFDATGTRVVGGRIAELNNQINHIQTLLATPEQAQKWGIKVPELDEFQVQELKSRLVMLNAEKAEVRFRFREINQQKGELRTAFQSLQKRYRDHVESQISEREQAENEEKEVAREAEKFKGEWKSTFETLATANKVPEKMLTKLWKRLVKSAKAHDGAITDLNAWMGAEMQEEMATVKEYHEYQSAQYATAKREDVAALTQPANGAAVAPTHPTQSANWEDRLRELDRARLRKP